MIAPSLPAPASPLQPASSPSRPLSPLINRALLLTLCAIAIALAPRARATGFYGPDDYLSGWTNLKETPEFYWETEVKRIAAEFHPTEKLLLVPRTSGGDEGTVDRQPMADATAAADAADFADAIKTGELKPADPEAAEKLHADARAAIAAEDDLAQQLLPAEPDSEFTDYDRGALAFHGGRKSWPEAKKAWLALLDRPAAQRHYRTVWAAFMLGKLAMKSNDPDAVQWFEKTRQLAAAGFADSLGMAADSYGWEGRSQWRLAHPDKAAPMFLNQLALGDPSAIVSLKALIPDRDTVEGMLNYGDDTPNPTLTGTAASDTTTSGTATTAADSTAATTGTDTPSVTGTDPASIKLAMAALAPIAADPLLRRLETAHILATDAYDSDWERSPDTTVSIRSDTWMKAIQAAHLSKVEDAEYIGWLAYATGRYPQAQHWLALSSGTTPAALWLSAKLDLRAGHLDTAAASMDRAWHALTMPPVVEDTGTTPDPAALFHSGSSGDPALTMEQWASGDLASLHLLRSDFLQALDIFVKGNLREDAAYVAERVLTADELKSYVDKMPPPPPAAKAPNEESIYAADHENPTLWLSYLLGRRLVREDRYTDAAKYLPASYAQLVTHYARALADGDNPKLDKPKRAAALSLAAWLARYDGMEFMGTEVAPDGFDSGGDFEDTDIAKYRLLGAYPAPVDYSQDTIATRPPLKMPYPPAKSEVARLKKNQIHPDTRYHYRVIATALALKAAALMPDGTNDLADLLNTAGTWSSDRDNLLADKCFNQLKHRAPNTEIGKQVLTKKWFTDTPGPWSDNLQSQAKSLHKQSGIPDEN